MNRGDWPTFYDPSKVGSRFEPNIGAAVAAGLGAGLRPVRKNDVQRLAFFIDFQCDFTDFPGEPGTLSVPGTVGDITRTIEWLYSNAEYLTGLMISLDQHLPYQIFYPTWWIGPNPDKPGEMMHPNPFTLITAADVKDGKWSPIYEADWSKEYVNDLGAFMIWPFHCMIGTPGAALVPALAEAIAFVAAARRIQPMYIFKGSVPKTEHYGPFAPCKLVTDHPQGGVNTVMLDAISRYQEIYVAGEAFQYCVATGMRQTIEHYEKTGQVDVLKRIRFLNDCTSPVQPFTDAERKAIEDEYRGKGIQLIRSTDQLAV